MKLTNDERLRIAKVYDHLTACRGKQSVQFYAKMFGINSKRLGKGFKEAYGKNLKDHELEQCMRNAKIRLEKGELVKELSSLLGYSSVGSFGRAFQKFYPHPPSYYRFLSGPKSMIG